MTNELKYQLFATNRFKKDYKIVRKRSNFNEQEFHLIVETLLRGKELPEKYCNHILEPKSERVL